MSVPQFLYSDTYLDSFLDTDNFDSLLIMMISSPTLYELIINKQSFWRTKTLELNNTVDSSSIKNWFYEYQRQKNAKVLSMGQNRVGHLKTNQDTSINLYKNIPYKQGMRIDHYYNILN